MGIVRLPIQNCGEPERVTRYAFGEKAVSPMFLAGLSFFCRFCELCERK